jgi:tetratricopeptide (TPR) repeat protein
MAYLPALNGGLIIDDGAHITKPELRSLQGLARIWYDVGATTQYYPVLHSAFWVEHKLWGDALLGYHLTNVLLHAAAALLIVFLMRHLSLPGAWLGAFVFALHPVCVESVAWISEQKNTLSAVCYLGAALAYLDFDRTRRNSRYFLALGLFVLALASKSVTASLPAALLVVFWWQRGRLDWRRDVLPLAPWLAMGAASGLFTAWVERRLIGAEGADFELAFVERFLVAGRAVWFYAGKLVWPSNLAFNYPRWQLDASAWWQYLFPLGTLAVAAGLLAVSRRRRGPLAAFLFFMGTLFPVLGFLNVYPFLYSFVADHYQYLATLGIIVPVSTMVAAAKPRYAAVAGSTLVVVLGVLTWRQAAIYQDAETLYRDTIRRNPESWLAHNNLGKILLDTPGGTPEAIPHLETALRLKPGQAMTHYNLGAALAATPGRLTDSIREYETAIRISPAFAEAHDGLGRVLLADRRLEQAIAEFEMAVRMAPSDPRTRNNLGTALARIGRLPEAISQFQAAARIDPGFAQAYANLGNALANSQRFPEAISAYETALRLEPALQPIRSRLEKLRALQ